MDRGHSSVIAQRRPLGLTSLPKYLIQNQYYLLEGLRDGTRIRAVGEGVGMSRHTNSLHHFGQCITLISLERQRWELKNQHYEIAIPKV
jgi:hypothetical protein